MHDKTHGVGKQQDVNLYNKCEWNISGYATRRPTTTTKYTHNCTIFFWDTLQRVEKKRSLEN